MEIQVSRMANGGEPSRGFLWPMLGVLGFWSLVYVPRVLAAHYAFRTNAYDLSVFDYALWSTLRGEVGFVPFFGHSLFAQHVMPTLLVLLPVYTLWQSPVTLILIQFGALAGAAALFWHQSLSRGLGRGPAACLLFGFLFSRPTHSAVLDVFYIESLEPLLVLALYAAAQRRRMTLYVPLLALALGCKEDMGLYLGLFGLLMAFTQSHRRLGWITASVSVAWTLVAMFGVIPLVRSLEGMPAAYPFLSVTSRPGQYRSLLLDAASALLSVSSAAKLFSLTGSTALLCWFAPRLLVPGLPALALGTAGTTLAVHGGFTGHYLWPLLPWLWLAALEGTRTISTRFPRALHVFAVAVVLITIANSPLWTSLRREFWPATRTTSHERAELSALPARTRLAVQPNLIPHVSHTPDVMAIGSDYPIAESRPDLVILSYVGNLWPLGPEGVRQQVDYWAADRRYSRCPDRGLIVFSRIGCDYSAASRRER